MADRGSNGVPWMVILFVGVIGYSIIDNTFWPKPSKEEREKAQIKELHEKMREIIKHQRRLWEEEKRIEEEKAKRLST